MRLQDRRDVDRIRVPPWRWDAVGDPLAVFLGVARLSWRSTSPIPTSLKRVRSLRVLGRMPEELIALLAMRRMGMGCPHAAGLGDVPTGDLFGENVTTERSNVSQANEYEGLGEDQRVGVTTTQPIRAAVVSRAGVRPVRVRRGRLPASPSAPLAWYEYLPTWVSISIFLHGLVLLLAIVVLASPETFGIASEGAADRNSVVQTAQSDALRTRVASLEQQLASARGTAPAAATAADTATSDALTQRLAALEGRLAAVCARSTPPC